MESSVAVPVVGGAGSSGRRVLRITYVTMADPTHPSSKLGEYYFGAALRHRFGDVATLGPLPRKRLDQGRFGLKKVMARWLLRQEMPIFCEPAVARVYANQIARQAKAHRSTLILSNHPVPLAYLDRAIPYAFWHDTTVSGMHELGWYLDGYSARTVSNWMALERYAVQGASTIFYTSTWAAECAIRDYDADPAKIHVVPIGANIDEPSGAEHTVAQPPGDLCRLLFFGRDWDRKGGDIAYAALKCLERAGIASRLTICGPPTVRREVRADPSVDHVPPIDKNRAAERRRFAELCQRTDYLILPTRADCTPFAIAEVAAFGVPSITSDVGGIPSIIRDGVDGVIVSRDAPAAEYAARIAANFQDPAAFLQLRTAARRSYLNRLNWDQAVDQMTQVLDRAV